MNIYLRLRYADGVVMARIFDNMHEVGIYLKSVYRSCDEHNFPYPEVTFDEWEKF